MVDEQSVWKKEISFRRKPKAPKPPPEPGEEATSVWKKEISFKRKGREAKPEPVAVPPPPPKGLSGEGGLGACWAWMNATPGESCW